MAIDIVLPDLGEGIDSGDVLEVLVSEGDTVDVEQGIVELETDKATMTVPCTHQGKVTKIHVGEGDSVAVGSALITIEPSGDAPGGDSQPESKSAPAEEPAAEKKPEAAPAEEPIAAEPVQEAPQEEEPEPAPVAEQPAPAQSAPVQAPAAQPAPVQPTAAPAVSVSIPKDVAASPAVRRFAREVGVSLDGIAGSGPGGRITREDVLNLVRQGGAGRPAASAPAQAPAKAANSTTKATPVANGQDSWGPVRVEKMSKIRRTIANKMHESWSTVPRVTNFDDADVTDLEEFRRASKDDYLGQGIKLTTMPFVIKAVALALRHHPEINASVDMEAGQVIYKDYVNVGIAVDTDRGLVVPSMRNADVLSIPDIARGLADMAENSRTGNFAIEDLRGSTFTISNLGAIGGTYSTPIINVPETAILLIGRSRKMPVVIGDEIKIRLMMPLSISYDHRLIDGGAAARFLNRVIGYLKAPSRLLLAL